MGKPDPRSDGGPDEPPFFKRAGLYLGVAFELPGTILAGLVLGYFLDRYFNSSPWLLLVFTLLAFAGAFIRLVRWVRFFSARRDGSDGEDRDSPN